ncbi:MAG: hypothetical protein AAGI03_14825 [Pseudomonadota bacterium]
MALDTEFGALFWVSPQTALFLCALEEELGEAEIIARLQQDLDLPRGEARNLYRKILEELSHIRHVNEAARTAKQDVDHLCGARIAGRGVPTIHCCQVAMLGMSVRVCLPTRSLLQSFLSVMGHTLTEACGPSDVVLRVVRDGNGYALIEGDTVTVERSSQLSVVSDLKAAVCHAAVNAQRYDACVHAAVIGVDGGAVLIPAASGRGKTCLALALAASGHTCLSDDLALVDLNDAALAVRGVPAASCVKSEAWGPLGVLHPELKSAPIHKRADGKTVKYLPIAAPSLEPVAVRAFVVPRFAEGASAQVVKLRPEVALEHVLSSVLAWRGKLAPHSVEALIKGLDNAPAFACTYDNPGAAVALFEDIIGEL